MEMHVAFYRELLAFEEAAPCGSFKPKPAADPRPIICMLILLLHSARRDMARQAGNSRPAGTGSRRRRVPGAQLRMAGRGRSRPPSEALKMLSQEPPQLMALALRLPAVPMAVHRAEAMSHRCGGRARAGRRVGHVGRVHCQRRSNADCRQMHISLAHSGSIFPTRMHC